MFPITFQGYRYLEKFLFSLPPGRNRLNLATELQTNCRCSMKMVQNVCSVRFCISKMIKLTLYHVVWWFLVWVEKKEISKILSGKAWRVSWNVNRHVTIATNEIREHCINLKFMTNCNYQKHVRPVTDGSVWPKRLSSWLFWWLTQRPNIVLEIVTARCDKKSV